MRRMIPKSIFPCADLFILKKYNPREAIQYLFSTHKYQNSPLQNNILLLATKLSCQSPNLQYQQQTSQLGRRFASTT